MNKMRHEVRCFTLTNNFDVNHHETDPTFCFILQFNKISVSKFVTLSLIVSVDPYFIVNRNASYHVAVLVKLWYYGEDGPCSRPPSLYNAQHETASLPFKFISTTG